MHRALHNRQISHSHAEIHLHHPRIPTKLKRPVRILPVRLLPSLHVPAPRRTIHRTHDRPPAGRIPVWAYADACAASSGPPLATGHSHTQILKRVRLAPKPRPPPRLLKNNPPAARTWRPCHGPRQTPSRSAHAASLPVALSNILLYALDLSSRARPAATGQDGVTTREYTGSAVQCLPHSKHQAAQRPHCGRPADQTVGNYCPTCLRNIEHKHP